MFFCHIFRANKGSGFCFCFFFFSQLMLPHLEDFMHVHLVEPFLHPVVLFLDLILEQSHHMQPHIHGVTSHPLELAMYPPTKHLIIHQDKNMWLVSSFIFYIFFFFAIFSFMNHLLLRRVLESFLQHMFET